jgi:hypothetical protein
MGRFHWAKGKLQSTAEIDENPGLREFCGNRWDFFNGILGPLRICGFFNAEEK